MEQANSPKQSNGSDGASLELRVVAIRCRPAPDAEERLGRLFTLLLEHAVEQRQATTDKGDAEEEG